MNTTARMRFPWLAIAVSVVFWSVTITACTVVLDLMR
jgi:hypothetical protein